MSQSCYLKPPARNWYPHVISSKLGYLSRGLSCLCMLLSCQAWSTLKSASEAPRNSTQMNTFVGGSQSWVGGPHIMKQGDVPWLVVERTEEVWSSKSKRGSGQGVSLRTTQPHRNRRLHPRFHLRSLDPIFITNKHFLPTS